MTTTNIAAAEATMVAAEQALNEAHAAWSAQFDLEHPEGPIAAFFAGAANDSDQLKALTEALRVRNLEAHEAREAFFEARGW